MGLQPNFEMHFAMKMAALLLFPSSTYVTSLADTFHAIALLVRWAMSDGSPVVVCDLR
jgi:hypothetical protein